MSICPGTDGKAWNSSLLAKGAADWSAAGAHLEGFPFKKVEEGLWKLTPLRGLNIGGGCQLAGWPPKVSSQTFCEEFWPSSGNPII